MKHKQMDSAEKAEQLYAQYALLVHNITYNILKSTEDAEDADIHVWEKVMRCIDEIPDITSQTTKGLIITLAERTAIDLYRQRCRQMEMEISLDRYEVQSYYTTKDREVDELEMKLWLRCLPKPYADVIISHYITGNSQREIAKMYGISETAVNMRMSRARSLLRERWKKDE